jgi:hypothetical protein
MKRLQKLTLQYGVKDKFLISSITVVIRIQGFDDQKLKKSETKIVT